MKTTIYILMASLLALSCKKNTTIKVHVENIATGKPYANHRVFIIEEPPVNFINKDRESIQVYNGYTNEEGNLLIDLKLKKNAKYTITSYPPDSMCYVHETSYPIQLQETNDIHFQFAPCAYFKLQINATNCEDHHDWIGVRWKPVYVESYVPGSFRLEGCYSYEHFEDTIPSGSWLVEWWINTEGLANYYSDTITLEENEHKVYEIDY